MERTGRSGDLSGEDTPDKILSDGLRFEFVPSLSYTFTIKRGGT